MFVCLLFVWVLTSLLNIRGHIATVPTCSSGTLIIVLPHRNVMPQTQDMTPHPITVYRHVAVLSIAVLRHTEIHSYPFECLGCIILKGGSRDSGLICLNGVSLITIFILTNVIFIRPIKSICLSVFGCVIF